jgi:hypothetical protein
MTVTFTKLFMHVSSQNMFPTIRNLQIYETDFSIIIVRNVCVLTSASMIVYLFITRSWSAIIGITVRENRIICCQIFCDLLLKSTFEQIFNVMLLILVKIKWHIKWKYLIQIFHDICLSYYFREHNISYSS